MWLFACAAAERVDSGPADTGFSPIEPGPYAVGTLEYESAGPDGLVLPTQAWFPTAAPGAAYEYDGVTPSPAATDGPPDCEAPRPVLLFSHGYSGIRWQSFFFAEHLASQGWVVVAPDHVHNTWLDLDDTLLAEVALRRPLDVAASFDALLTQPSLGACADPDAGYAVAGHSFGGFTTLAVLGGSLSLAASVEACADGGWLCDVVDELVASYGADAEFPVGDPRAWAGLPMAPAGYDVLVGALPEVTEPSLVLAGDEDDQATLPEVEAIWAATGGDASLAVLAGASHYSFSDACTILPTDEFCAGSIALDEAHELIAGLGTAWLRRQLGDAVDLPEDPAWSWGEE